MNERRYSVKAMQNVVIRAFVRVERESSNDGATVLTPYNHEEWIALEAGEQRDGLMLVIGVLPSCAPEQQPVHWNGTDVVIHEHPNNSDLPKDFFGLYRLSIDAPQRGTISN